MASTEESIEEQISSLKERLDTYSQEIQRYVLALHGEAAGAVNLRQDPRRHAQILQSDLQQLLSSATDHQTNTAQSQSDLRASQDLVSALTAICDSGALFEQFREEVNQHRVRECCMTLRQLDASVARVAKCGPRMSEGRVLRALKRELRKAKATLIAQLQRLFNHCVQVQFGTISVKKVVQGVVEGELVEPAVSLSELWHGLLHVEQADEVVQHIVTHAWERICAPLWNVRRMSPADVRSAPDSSELTFAVLIKEHRNLANSMGTSNILMDVSNLNLSDRSDWSYRKRNKGAASSPQDTFRHAPKMNISSLLEHLSVVLSFIHAEVLGASPELLPSLAAAARTISLQEVLANAIRKAIPSDESALAAFMSPLKEQCKLFEARLQQMSILSDADPQANILSEVVDSVEKLYRRKRREVSLLRAREVLLLEYHNTMHAYGDVLTDDPASVADSRDDVSFDDRVLSFESCQVSIVCFKLLRSLHECLAEACQASAEVAEVLFHAARDHLELFRAIVPVKNADVIDSVPRMAAVFYNDCMYIAHNVVSIVHEYRPKLPESLRRTAAMVDFIPIFRDLGSAYLTARVDEHRAQLAEATDRMRLFMAESTSHSPTVNCEYIATEITTRVKQLSQAWQGVLQRSVYDRLIGQLIDEVYHTMVDRTLAVDSVLEEETHTVYRAFGVLQEMTQVLHERESLSEHAPSWQKFVVLTDLLEHRLNEIAELLPRGKFSSFTADEMIHLIRALFEDNPRRQAVITSIQSMK